MASILPRNTSGRTAPDGLWRSFVYSIRHRIPLNLKKIRKITEKQIAHARFVDPNQENLEIAVLHLKLWYAVHSAWCVNRRNLLEYAQCYDKQLRLLGSEETAIVSDPYEPMISAPYFGAQEAKKLERIINDTDFWIRPENHLPTNIFGKWAYGLLFSPQTDSLDMPDSQPSFEAEEVACSFGLAPTHILAGQAGTSGSSVF